jgi:hypothetical protein
MAETIPAEAVATTPVAEPTLEEQLKTLLEPPVKESPETPAPPAPETTPPAEEVKAEPSLDEQLKEIEDTPAVPETPKLSAEQEQILKIIPSAQAAQAMSEQVSGYQAFTGALQSGNYAAVENMLTEWNPAVLEGWMEHVYQAKVSSGEWVDRWIADKEGNPSQRAAQTAAERRIAALEAKIARDQEERTRQEQSAQHSRTASALVKHIDTLYDKISFAPADRKIVSEVVYNRINGDPATLAAIRNGNVAAVNSIWKNAVRDYVQRDKQMNDGQAAALKAQEVKKPLVPSTTVQALGALPDDVKSVPKDKLDEWEDQQLEKLFASQKGKRR